MSRCSKFLLTGCVIGEKDLFEPLGDALVGGSLIGVVDCGREAIGTDRGELVVVDGGRRTGMTRGDGSFVRCRRRKSIKMGSNIS
jgi:hypothetical protein